MAVYWIALHGEPFERLMSDPQHAGLPDEVQSAALYTGFELHVIWPQSGALHLIVEGDGDVEELVGLVSTYLAGGGWEAEVTRAWAAENPPEGLAAGAQAQWVIERATPPLAANEPESRRCDLCQEFPVPPHGEPCDAHKRDDGTFSIRDYPPRDSSGDGTSESPEKDHDMEIAVPLRMSAT